MRNLFSKFFLVLAFLAICGLPVLGQTTSSLTGTVTDPTGAVVPGASVVVRNNETGSEYTAKTNDDGVFTIPSLATGMYTATISVKNFKQAKVTEIKIDVGKPSSIAVALEIGSQAETVTIVGGGELLQTQTATIGTTLTGRQITDIPTVSRDALDLVLALPGTTTPGRPRTSSVNGLPKGALNITLDGINVQDNLLKSSDGFFTYIRPRTDAMAEVTISTSNPGAESSSEGAVQIKFVTQAGSNDYHGGIYWYHRNPQFNANYWFNNRDLAADPVTGKAPQQRILLNQFGGKVGGPISLPKVWSGKDRAFFFINYEEYRLPEKSSPRTRTLLTTDAASGIFKFTTTSAAYAPAPATGITCTAPGGTRTCSVNVLTLAAAKGLPSTIDPTIGTLLGSMRSAAQSVNAVFVNPAGAPNVQQFTFFNIGGQTRRFPTVRLDANIGKNHHLENVSNYQQFDGVVDFLNSADPAFPDFPNHGSQVSSRFSNSSAWRWTVTPNIVNEARFGLQGGTAFFFSEITPAQFSNQGGVSLNLNGALGVTNATVRTAPSRRNTPVQQFNDNLNWVTGNHSLNFGVNVTRVSTWSTSSTVVPTVGFGISSTLAGDTAAFAAFSDLAATVNQQGNAATFYAGLVGRISSITRVQALSETTGKYTLQGDVVTRAQQTEYGVYGQDTWRVRPNLTLTGGLRWEVQGPFYSLNDSIAQVSYAGLFGESGEGNLFKPGTLTGTPSTYTAFPQGQSTWKTQYGNFAPSVGFSWSPNFKSNMARKAFGESGQTVLRGGFSMAYVREGINTFLSIMSANPGLTLSATQNITGSPFPLTFGNLFRSGLPAPSAGLPTAPVYPNTGAITDGVNAFLPNLKTGYVESWSMGIQREINKDNVLEVRYIGNRGHKLWRQTDLNEINVFENGFLQEFRNAQANTLANLAAGQGFNMRYRGPGTGTVPLPILMKFFTANLNPALTASYASSLFANTTLLSPLNPNSPSPLGLAATLNSTGNEATFNPNRVASGVPVNFFVVNQGKRGGAFLVDNNFQTWYDAVTVEFRRRMADGLLLQANYTFGKALVNGYASNADLFDQPVTLRDFHLRKNVAPFDVTQAFKTNFIYELPFGRGKMFMSDANGLLNHFLGDWTFNGNVRIQSGSPFSLGNVQVVGMTVKDLQNMVGVYRSQPNSDGTANTREVYSLPADVRLNTFRANNTTFTAAGAVYTQGAPTGAFIAPAGFGNCQQGYTGQCGYNNLVLKGPAFFRFDLSLTKRIRFTERMNLELRAEALNAFNNINWLIGSAANDVNTLGGLGAATFGRYTAAYQDISTTNDPGGRLVQLVLRFNF
ncbi:MAG: outer membrane beta-barrel protein [Pyrinomonadaceae bacterium]